MYLFCHGCTYCTNNLPFKIQYFLGFQDVDNSMSASSRPSSIPTSLTATTSNTNKPETDPCALSPCKNNGKCNSENGKVKCKCSLPYYGTLCEHTKNPCQYGKCLNGGTCAPNKDFTDYTCVCPQGIEGQLCEKKSGE